MTQDYETAVKEYLRLREQREHIDEQLDALKEQLRGLGEGTHEIGDAQVRVEPNRRIDPPLVAEEYPVEQHPELYKATPDTAALRKHLAPIRVEQLMKSVGPPKVTVSA